MPTHPFARHASSTVLAHHRVPTGFRGWRTGFETPVCRWMFPTCRTAWHRIFGRWQQTLAEHVGTPSAEDLFIAHSLGTISLLHYLSATRPARIGGLILVSGFGARLPALPGIQGYDIDTYVDQARLDRAAIRAMTSKIFCIISQNDVVVAPEESLKLARQLNATVRMVPKGGHFLASEGFHELPVAWRCADSIIRSAAGIV